MNDDSIAAVARAAAERLTPDYGPQLSADVEAALHGPGSHGSGYVLEQYDPVALGSLIVGIAQLAYMFYANLKKKTPDTPPEVAARALREELRRHGDGTPDSDKIAEVIVAEVVYRAGGAKDD